MTDPFARPLPPTPEVPSPVRAPQAFAPAAVPIEATDPDFEAEAAEIEPSLPLRRARWPARLAWGAGSLFVSLGLGLMAERLIRDLFARYEWLGWAGVALLAAFGVALLALIVREVWALRRLRVLDGLRRAAAAAALSDGREDGRRIEQELVRLYADRADLARARTTLAEQSGDIFDGGEIVRFAERTLMHPLDARARALTAASARRVALVTAVSPRALVDIAYVIFESVRLAGAVAAHLAVTGGLVLTDGLVEQLVGQGLAARLSQRLGEGVVNGLMTVRVGIAAMRVVRPLPFATEKPPQVRDFIPELVKLAERNG